MRSRYGVTIVNLKYDIGPAAATAVSYEISWEIAPRYKGTGVHFSSSG